MPWSRRRPTEQFNILIYKSAIIYTTLYNMVSQIYLTLLQLAYSLNINLVRDCFSFTYKTSCQNTNYKQKHGHWLHIMES